MVTSPSTENYQLGKGVVSVSDDDGSTWRDVGNVSSLEWTPTVDKLDHFSSREGVKKKDKSVALTTAAALKMTMDEITADNLAMLVLGTPQDNTAGDTIIKSMELSSVDVLVKFEAANDVGPKIDFIGKVSFLPTGSFQFISDSWNLVQVTGDMLDDDTYGLGQFTQKAEVSA